MGLRDPEKGFAKDNKERERVKKIEGKMEKLRDLVERYYLKLILIFGSYAKGESHPDSDMDIAVYSKRVLSEEEKINLTYELCNIFRTHKIDLVDIKTASPLLKMEVFKDYIVLYQEDSRLLHQLELVSIYEFKESEVLYQLRHERLQEFIG